MLLEPLNHVVYYKNMFNPSIMKILNKRNPRIKKNDRTKKFLNYFTRFQEDALRPIRPIRPIRVLSRKVGKARKAI